MKATTNRRISGVRIVSSSGASGSTNATAAARHSAQLGRAGRALDEHAQQRQAGSEGAPQQPYARAGRANSASEIGTAAIRLRPMNHDGIQPNILSMSAIRACKFILLSPLIALRSLALNASRAASFPRSVQCSIPQMQPSPNCAISVQP